MTFSAGTLLGMIEMLSPLGAGGMGEVRRARGIRLGREVALQIAEVLEAAHEAGIMLSWFTELERLAGPKGAR
jgi:hypothetical protein